MDEMQSFVMAAPCSALRAVEDVELEQEWKVGGLLLDRRPSSTCSSSSPQQPEAQADCASHLFDPEAAFDMDHLFLNTEGHPLKRREL